MLCIAFGLLLRVGVAVIAPPAMLVPWQWAAGLLVLPLFVRGPRLGGVAAMLFFVCLAAALATGVGWVADVPVVAGAALLSGGAALLTAVVAARVVRSPPPEPVSPAALNARLDTPEALEAADKTTRE